MKVVIIAPGPRGRSETEPFLKALATELGAQRIPWHEGAWPAQEGADVVFSFAKFRHLAEAPTIDWRGFDGLRVHYDWDALQDGHWRTSPYAGRWAPTLLRHRFDLLITTGYRSRDHLRDQGLQVETVHKGYDRDIVDLGDERPRGFCTFGVDYPARLLAKSQLRRAGIDFDEVKVEYPELGATLNDYVACILCTFDGWTRGGAIGSALHRWMPGPFVEVGSAPEPMGKLFEASGAGCAPIVEWTPDLENLGFVDEVNAVVYRDIEELVARTLEYRQEPERLRPIGRAAAALAAERHTWQHRARHIRAVLEQNLRSSANR